MAKRPDDRYPSAAAFAEAIGSALAAPPPAPPPSSSAQDDSEATMIGATLVRPPVARPAPALPRSAAPSPVPAAAVVATGRSRAPVLIGVGVAAVLALGAGGWFLSGGSKHGPPGQTATGQQATGQQATEQQATGQQGTGQQGTVQQGSGQQATGQQATGQQGTGLQGTGQQATGQQGAGQQATGQQGTGQQATGQDTAGQVRPAPSQQQASNEHQTPAAAPSAEALSAASPSVPPVGAPVAQPTAPPQTPPVALAPPPTTQEASTDLHALRQQIAQALAQAPCTLANGLLQDSGGVSISGYAGTAETDALRQQLAGLIGAAPLDWHVEPVDQVFCGALGALRPIAVQAGAPVSGLSVVLAGGQTTLHDGERIMPRLTMADFAGEVRMDYLGHDGLVVHLYPTVADPAQHVPARRSVRLTPGAQLSIGEGGPGQPVWEVGPPYGTDMIIVVASSVPVLTRTPTQNVEDNATPYLRDLTSGIARVRQAGGRITGTLLLVNTLPK